VFRALVRPRTVVLSLVALALVVAGAAAWVGLRAAPVRTHLTRAADLVLQLEREIRADDLPGARATLAALRTQTRAASSTVDSPDWRWGTLTPVVGEDLFAVRVVADVLDDLTRRVLTPLLDLGGTLSLAALVPHGGRLAVAPIRRAARQVAALDRAAREDLGQVGAIAQGRLTAPVAAAVARFTDGLRRLTHLTGTAATATALLPGMLGVDGPRTYLVVFQNLAEARATGGMPGAFVVVSANAGAIRIVDEGTAIDLGNFDRPVLPLGPDVLSLYTDRPGVFPADVNLTPDFPTAAALFREMYRRRTGRGVDGVLATDPVALSYLLRATGPLRTPTGDPLDSGNAVRLLLSDVYARMASVPDKDRYFASTARTVFDALSRGAASPPAAVAALAQAAAEHRVLVWSRYPGEEARLAGTVLEGALPRVESPATPTVGVFLNDGSGAKLDYYLTRGANLNVGDCRPDGRRELRLRVVLGSTVPRTSLPEHVLGLRLGGDPYTVRTNVMVFAPVHGGIVDMRRDGVPVPFGAGTEHGRAVGVLTTYLTPGQHLTVDVGLLTAAGAAGPVSPRLWVTPGVNDWQLSAESGPNC
jgi:hypothetical protein